MVVVDRQRLERFRPQFLGRLVTEHQSLLQLTMQKMVMAGHMMG